MKRLIYYLSLIVSALDMFAIAGAALFVAWEYYLTQSLDGVRIQTGIVVLCALLVLYPVMNVVRRKSRVDAKFDQYGRMQSSRSYAKLSVKEQKELDRQRMLQEEKLLPSTQIHEMTQNGAKNPEAELKKLTGLASVKKEIAEMEARMEFDAGRRKGKEAQSHHLCFAGAPGTGKTTIASVMTAYLYRYHIIKKNRMIVTSGAYISGAGTQAAARMQAIIRCAYGGVLLIDEAYAMMDSAFGDEAVAALIQEMEVHRDKFVLILAGYEDEMKALLASNPGFASRIAKVLHFEDFTNDELFAIFSQMLRSEGFTIEQGEVRGAFEDVIARAKAQPSFGNARTVRSIVDHTISRHAYHIKHDRSGRKKHVIAPDDVAYEHSLV